MARVKAHTSSAGRPISKKERILTAAGMLFPKDGLTNTTMDAVAARADVSKATLYKYFPTKHELFAAVVADAGERHWHASLSEPSTRQAMPAALLPVARAVIELLLSADTVACYRMVVAEASRLPELGAAYYQGGAERLLNRLEQYFTTAIEGGQLRAARPRVMAEHFVGLVRGDLQLRALLGIKNDLFERQKDVAIRVGVDAFYRAYAPDLGRG